MFYKVFIHLMLGLALFLSLRYFLVVVYKIPVQNSSLSVVTPLNIKYILQLFFQAFSVYRQVTSTLRSIFLPSQSAELI